MTTDTITIEPFAPAHLPDARRLSVQAGWPHRAEDWALTLSTSRGVVARADGQVVGTALCSLLGDVATLNMIIVDEAMRGRGLGRRLMDAAMALAEEREMRLVATTDGLPLYEKLGFRSVGRVHQHQGLAQGGVPALAVRSGTPDDAARHAALDTAASGLQRDSLLRRIAEEGEVLLAEGGFALIRPFGRGDVVGPIVADDPDTARALLTEAARRHEGRFLRVDLRDPGLVPLATDLGLAPAGGGTAMVKNARPMPAATAKTYALVSQALG
ncbi:GNAT family N-acetyltransferase [Falsirhodobacter sp. 20TX0035]|uniref:GNAT family N-acetyltransferase n=1 Tax=Falsirhodobacter sp. 20TX0035 TaxID=3022019 RepID=UPI00232E7F6C|nr:GNAT family N-acetyltransferase [Falsirhodobacter sp. 20TX0035]MDB6454322.1 GNAT family N-acetyltransferase [Falsirhodobacter sp. 20TX0035]